VEPTRIDLWLVDGYSQAVSPLERYDLLITRAETEISTLRQLQGRIESRQPTKERTCLVKLIGGRIAYAESRVQLLVEKRSKVFRRMP
jgi:hypothetical protein